jgi:hypothetical protein
MCPSIAHERLDRLYSNLVLKTLSNIGRCSMIMEISAQKIEALHMGLKTKNKNFLRSCSNEFD